MTSGTDTASHSRVRLDGVCAHPDTLDDARSVIELVTGRGDDGDGLDVGAGVVRADFVGDAVGAGNSRG